MSVQDDLRAALRVCLLADPHVKMAFGNALQIYAERPAKDVFPYVILNMQKTTVHEAYDVRLAVVTHRENRAGVVSYLDAIAAALRTRPIDIPGHPVAACRIRLRDIFTDDSYKTRNGVLHLRFVINSMETIN